MTAMQEMLICSLVPKIQRHNKIRATMGNDSKLVLTGIMVYTPNRADSLVADKQFLAVDFPSKVQN